MTGVSDLLARDLLDFTISSYPYVALFTTVGLDDGSGFTEVIGGSYGRFATSSGDWGPITGSSPTVMTNQANFVFPIPTADWGIIYGWGLLDSPTDGNIGVSDYIGNSNWIPSSISQGSPAIITASRGHGYLVGDYVIYSIEYGGISPVFSQSNLTGLLRVAHVSTDTFDVTNGGLQVNTNSTGSGFIKKISPQTILSGQSPILFPAGSLTLSSA